MPSRFAVIPRRGSTGQIRWFEAEATYALHFVNAYEDGHEIVLDDATFDRIFQRLRGAPVMEQSHTEIARCFYGLANELTRNDVDTKRAHWSLFKTV